MSKTKKHHFIARMQQSMPLKVSRWQLLGLVLFVTSLF